MLKTFIISFKLKNTYRVNSIIYSIRQLPLIKRILSNKLYKSRALKIIGNIISIIVELLSIFIGKLLYILAMIIAVIPFYKTNTSLTFLHLFTFLTLIGGILNTYMFNPTKDKYYAMIIMNMDAKKYTLVNYYYSMLKVIVGFLPFTIIFGMLVNVPIGILIILPIYVVMVKMIVSAYGLIDFSKTKIAKNENLPTKLLWITIVILLLISYGLPVVGITINEIVFIIIFIGSLIFGIYSFFIINKFDEYKKMYKQLLTNENVYAVKNNNSTKVIRENVSKQIVLDKDITSNKTGFAYFHDLFVKRHKKILTKSVKTQAFVISLIFIVLFIVVLLNEDAAKEINGMLLTYLPYFVFIMYLLNRGSIVTQAMFMNCDHSMLTYRIYRTQRVILGLFKERLKTLIKVNLLPALVIAIGLPILLLITGGTSDGLNYVVLFISIIAMSIFFSVHYLVMYYLLQPYNISTEIKSSTYKVVQWLTYFGCYYMIDLQLPTISFGIAMSAFCILYSLISLFIAYKYAPKTFKIRI